MVWNKIKGIFSQPEPKVEIATTEIPSALISQEQHSEPKKIKKKIRNFLYINGLGVFRKI